jgi:hypothetical protein
MRVLARRLAIERAALRSRSGSARRCSSPAHAGRTQAPVARGRLEELDRAQHILEQAEDTAGRLGAEGITREVAECRDALTAISG